MHDQHSDICVVTGACGPVGWEIAKHMTCTGLHVIAVDLPSAVAQRKLEASGMKISFIPLDLTDPSAADSVSATVDEMGGSLRVLVNNAALTGGASLSGYVCAFEDQTDEAFDLALTLNLAVPFRIVRRLAPCLRRTKGSVVVNIASIYGILGPDLRLYESTSMGNPAGYAASKGGLVQLTRYLSTVLAPQVRVNCVAPGGLARGQNSAFVERYEARTPLGRMGSERDVAEAVGWLASDSSAYVTGQILVVDGGWTVW